MPSPHAFDLKRTLKALSGPMLGVWLWGVHGVQGNDTGGIIPWSPMSADEALAIAGAHCSRYDKYAVITSVRPWPGDYVGFVCRMPGRWGPVANGGRVSARKATMPIDK
jgi:hypothetical protein